MLNHVAVGYGKPVLILHGSTLDHRHMIESFAPVFATVPGWTPVYADMPGHGRSPSRGTIATQDDVLEAVIGFATDLSGRRVSPSPGNRAAATSLGVWPSGWRGRCAVSR